MESQDATQPGTLSFTCYKPVQPFYEPTPSSKFYHIDSYYAATQLVMDPRRLGQAGSGLSDEDLADICCILNPHSEPARRACAAVHEATPKHTIKSNCNVQFRERDDGQFHLSDHYNTDSADPDSYCIALRLSANLKDPAAGGFLFGRNSNRCDVVIGGRDASKRISNIHFRIYVNEYGVIMLEDQSTNGTAVEGILLRAKDKENGLDYRHTLESGNIIVLAMNEEIGEEDYRFVVRIPQRDQEAEDAYQDNLTAYCLRVNQARYENEHKLANQGIMKRELLNLFPAPGTATTNPTSILISRSLGRQVREWKGGHKYNKVCRIGKGAFAVVYKITSKFDGVPYAAKELEKRRFMKNGILDQKVDMEMNIMRKIKHPNIVQYIEHIDWEEYLYIIMEYVPGGDLGSLINERGALPEIDVKSMAAQLLSALKYLHQGGITHRDVKPDNILISNHDILHVKLTDFGLSKMVDGEETFLRTFCGTLLYCAPEVYSEYREYDESGKRTLRGLDKKSLPPQRYGHAVDIWSFAGVLFYSLCGNPPYPVKNGTSYQELLNQVMTQPLDIRPLQRANVSENGIRCVRQMLHIKPAYRATIEQLENSPWFIGSVDLEISMEEDEVDTIGESDLDPRLAEGASHLSIRDPEASDMATRDDVSDSIVKENQQAEIQSSLNAGEGNSSGSYGFSRQSGGNLSSRRLFGEVNISDIEFSGAPSLSQLNFPLPPRNIYPRSLDVLQYTRDDTPHSPVDIGSFQRIDPTPRIEMLRLPPTLGVTRVSEIDAPIIASSLLGTESMVEHLNMHSPVTAISSDVGSAAVGPVGNATVSLRRPHADDLDEPWRQSDLGRKRRRKSERGVEIPIPVSIFWDPKDKSTHHNNYPTISTCEYGKYDTCVERRHGKFSNVQKTFDITTQSFRSRESPSLQHENARQALSEPAKGSAGRIPMKRDDRRLPDDAPAQGWAAGTGCLSQDKPTPGTASALNMCSPGAPIDSTLAYQPVVGNDFQPSKQILAKLIATKDSCLPTITMNLTESMTSWGRGTLATVRYSQVAEIRIPKYAYKIFLFKPGFYHCTTPSNDTPLFWRSKDQDMRFYISTKATAGIWINETNLPSFNRQNPTTESKYWGELKHGDLITVWRNDSPGQQEFTRFRFECFWGKSSESRKVDEEFKLIEDIEFLLELEQACCQQEQTILAENHRRQTPDM